YRRNTVLPAMGRAPVLEQKYSLPGSKLELPIGDRNYFARPRERHPNVRRAVIRPFVVVLVIRVFGHEALEEFFQIAASGGRGVFHDDETAARMAHKDRRRPGRDFASRNDLLDFIGNFVRPLAFRSHLEGFCVHGHRGMLAAAPRAASFRFAQGSEGGIVLLQCRMISSGFLSTKRRFAAGSMSWPRRSRTIIATAS